MNCQVDVIIIGDSRDGHEILKKIATASPAINIAFVSREFKNATTHDFLNVEYIKDEVLFTDYKNRLFGCYLKSGSRLYSTHLIVASGLAYEPLKAGSKIITNAYNNVDNIPKTAKYSQAIVIGQNDSDVKFALAVAKKYKYVYFCMDFIGPQISDKNIQKLINVENIVVLPNTTITKFNIIEDDLSNIELSNYSNLTCSAVFVKTPATPETAFISDKLIEKDENGYLRVSKQAESTIVPKCYAVGTCATKTTQSMRNALIENILNDFGGITNAKSRTEKRK